MTRVFVLFSILVLVVACAEQQVEKQKNSLVVDEASELVILMRQMEAHMLQIKGMIDSNSTFDAKGLVDYSNMYTVKANSFVKRDSVFLTKGSDFLQKFEELTKAKPLDSLTLLYNNAVNSCISCHMGYCPGPVKRIKKLTIKNE